MNVRAATILATLTATATSALSQNVRQIEVVTDITEGAEQYDRMRMWQAESVDYIIHPKRRNQSITFPAGAEPVWHVFPESNPTSLYVNVTGTISNAKATISLTPAQSNIPTGDYRSVVSVYNGATYMGVIADASMTVEYSPASATVEYVGTYSPLDGSLLTNMNASLVFGSGTIPTNFLPPAALAAAAGDGTNDLIATASDVVDALPADLLVDADIGVTVQAYDADLDDLADGTLSTNAMDISTLNVWVLDLLDDSAGTHPIATDGYMLTDNLLIQPNGNYSPGASTAGIVFQQAGLTAGLGSYGDGLWWSTKANNGVLRSGITSFQQGSDGDQMGLTYWGSWDTNPAVPPVRSLTTAGSSAYVSGSLTVTNGLTLVGGMFTGNGSGLTNLDATDLDEDLIRAGGDSYTGTHDFSAATVTGMSLPGSAITSGTIASNYLNMTQVRAAAYAEAVNAIMGDEDTSFGTMNAEDGNVTFTLTAGAFVGNGASITDLNGSAITTGTVADARIASTLTRDTEWDTAAEINAATTDEDFVTDSDLLDLTVSNLTLTGTFDGLSAMTLSVSNLAAQVVSGPTNYAADADTGMTIAGDLTLSIQGDIIADADILPADDDTQSLGSVAYRWQNIHALTGTIENVAAGFGVFSDLLTADAFSGNGADLTALPAAELTGTIPVAVRHPAYKEVISSSHTLTASECYNGAKYWVTAAATLTLPPVAEDMEIIVIADGANAVSVDANAADRIKLDGTALDDGDKITSDGTAGAVVVLSYRDADGWYATTDGLWSDGGP